MGYTTTFSNRINLSRSLTGSEAQTLKNFSDERHGGNVGGYTTRVPGYWCDWVPTDDLEGIEWSGMEKFYDADEWMQYILDEFITPWGIVANGVIDAQGEDASDVWRLKVINNKVVVQQGRVVFEDAE